MLRHLRLQYQYSLYGQATKYHHNHVNTSDTTVIAYEVAFKPLKTLTVIIHHAIFKVAL